jgi:hypothetical protein
LEFNYRKSYNFTQFMRWLRTDGVPVNFGRLAIGAEFAVTFYPFVSMRMGTLPLKESHRIFAQKAFVIDIVKKCCG